MFVISGKFPNNEEYAEIQKKGTYVQWNDCRIKREPHVLYTDSLHSSLCLTLFNPESKTGILANIRPDEELPPHLNPKKIVGTLLMRMKNVSMSNLHHLEATLSGGGVVSSQGKKGSSIILSSLNKYGIPLIGKDLGNSYSRIITLNCSDGNVGIHRERGISI